ncbi:MAG: UDP-N-acetylmuramoyl-tripeptide--D-alanyl-D-alanine ligase [Crocinitomicaceae bacterium]|nr:UDP-N-acetylmuramoyl-tripeptide--D-alanyl-D-alanine ligase [Crocinitomicaceae bacterium]
MQNIYKEYLSSSQVCTDTRAIVQDCIFFALKGDNFNGNHFVNQAIELGARIAIVDEETAQIPGKTMLVKDCLNSLQDLAKYHRNVLTIPIIGLTGSNGKTTTKELIAAVLSTKYKVFATTGNLNNHIGVPLSILSINKNHEVAIIEMGANHQKEIEFLAALAKPNYGLITNIGRAHLEGFGGIKGVLKGKKELYDYLTEVKGSVFINQSDAILTEIEPTETNNYYYGGKSSISGEILSNSELLNVSITINNKHSTIQTKLVGSYNLNNILAAACIGNHFKVNLAEIKLGLENYVPDNHRSQFIETEKNQIILDAYNANPSSVEAALLNFSQRKEINKLVILGDMLELGSDSSLEHESIFQRLIKLDLEAILVGKEFKKLQQNQFICFENAATALDHLQKNIISDTAILIKGSRGIQLELVLSAL